MESKATADDLTSLASSFPLLVYDRYDEQPDNSQIMLSVADGSTHTCRVPEIQNCRCLETQRGLVLAVDTTSLQCSLWNPQTGGKIPLPALDKPLPEYCRCLLSDTISDPPLIASSSSTTSRSQSSCSATSEEGGSGSGSPMTSVSTSSPGGPNPTPRDTSAR
ncbi:unnamed protein product [Urochloa humidicola]